MEVIEFLESSQKRGLLVDSLLDTKAQLGLFEFNGERLKINSMLNDISFLVEKRKPLYQRWIQKTGNKERLLNVPKKPLRFFIENYLLDFIKREHRHETCHGGEKGWSVKRSLETHLPCKSVLSFDLESAFENIFMHKVYDLFYELSNGFLADGERKEIANFLSVICTVRYSDKRGLPQGSLCSMALFNRILYPLDKILFERGAEREFRYSRWVDDLTISSPREEEIGNFLGAVELTGRDFPVSREKIFFQDKEIIYLLGHKFINREVLKNTKEEKEKYKPSSICFDDWFGENKKRNYDSWE